MEEKDNKKRTGQPQILAEINRTASELRKLYPDKDNKDIMEIAGATYKLNKRSKEEKDNISEIKDMKEKDKNKHIIETQNIVKESRASKSKKK